MDTRLLRGEEAPLGLLAVAQTIPQSPLPRKLVRRHRRGTARRDSLTLASHRAMPALPPLLVRTHERPPGRIAVDTRGTPQIRCEKRPLYVPSAPGLHGHGASAPRMAHESDASRAHGVAKAEPRRARVPDKWRTVPSWTYWAQRRDLMAPARLPSGEPCQRTHEAPRVPDERGRASPIYQSHAWQRLSGPPVRGHHAQRSAER